MKPSPPPLRASLLDRLCDEQPERREEEARAPGRNEIRDAVLRDLDWLFNATRPALVRHGEGLEQVRHSVLNYGLPTFSGLTASSADPNELAAQVREAILDYEPRLDPQDLEVQALTDTPHLDRHNLISFRIRGQLRPLGLQLQLRTDIDLETGRVRVQELGR